jgi:hypothetical protein
MKKTVLISLLLLITAFGFAQPLTEVKVRVIDSETKTGIENADVLIQEIMMVSKTMQFGLASFPSIPVRQVTIEVQKEGYLPKKEEINITADKFNNTFSIELIKEKANQVTIYGIVKAGSKRVSNVTVTLTIGDYKKQVKTSASGDYSFQVPKEKINTKVNLLFTHSIYGPQEVKFDILQNQLVKEVENVLLSEDVQEEEQKNSVCFNNSSKHFSGMLCFDNQTGRDIMIYESSAYLLSNRAVRLRSLFLAANKTNCTPNLIVNLFAQDNETYEPEFYFQTIPKNNMEEPLYAKKAFLIEKCKKKVIVLNNQNIHFAKEKIL